MGQRIRCSVAIVVALVVTCVMLAGCAQTDGSSSSTAKQPAASVAITIGEPLVAFERAADSDVVVRVSMPVDVLLEERDGMSSSPSARSVAAFVLTDGDEAVSSAKTGSCVMPTDREGSTSIDVTFKVPSQKFGEVSAVQVDALSWGTSKGLLVREAFSCSFGREKEAFLEAERQAQAAAEEQRKQQEHEADWRTKYSTEDFSDTLLIGDSIMQNATASLMEALPGAILNADAGRTLEKGGLVFENQDPDCGVLDHVRKDDGSYARYVIHTGNNDVSGVTIDDAEEIVRCLGEDKQIYFVTMIVTGNSHGTQTTNETIDAMVEKHPNVHKIDWYGLVIDHVDEYLSDGCHPLKSREPDYAALLKEGLSVVY